MGATAVDISANATSNLANPRGVPIVIPTGGSVGDLLVMAVFGFSIVTPSGWTLIATAGAGGGFQLFIYTRPYQTGDGGTTVTPTASSGTNGVAGCIYRVTGADLVTTPAVGIDHASVAGVDTIPSVTFNRDSGVLLSFFGVGLMTTWPAVPPMNINYNYTSATGPTYALAAYSEQRASAGATGTRTATNSGGSGTNGRGVSVAIEAARPGNRMII